MIEGGVVGMGESWIVLRPTVICEAGAMDTGVPETVIAGPPF